MAQSRFVDVEGVHTHYLEAGSGMPLVLLHGAAFGIDATFTWQCQVDELGKRFRVIAVDQIGFGKTDMPKDGRYLDRLERATHVMAFMRKLGVSKAILAGHSEGAFTATYIALEAPELASKLILLTSGGTSPAFGDARDKVWMDASDALYDYRSTVPTEQEFLDGLKKLLKRWDAGIEAQAKASYKDAAPRGQFEMLAKAPATEKDYHLYTQLQAKHIHPRLKQLACPTLLLWSKNDPTVPPGRGLLLLDMIRQADFHVLANTAHCLMIDRPDAVNSIIAQWAKA